MHRRAAALGLLLSLSLVTSACGSGDGSATQEQTGKQGIRLFGVDGNMTNAFSEQFRDPHVITGMVGTAAMTRVPDAFRSRLLAINPKITGFNYAPETYDAVVITALATALARTTDATTVAKYVVGVTTASPGDVVCTSPAACLAAIEDGKDIAYRGLAVTGGFTAAGEPATASYGTRHFGRDYKIDEGKTEYVVAGDASKASTARPPAPVPAGRPAKGAPLRLGVLLPRTGDLAFQGPPMFAGAELAIRDLNAAGGVLGKKVESVEMDDGTNPAKAQAAVAQLAAEGVHMVIGPSTSGESAVVIPKAVAAGMMVISGSATSDKLSDVDDSGLFFRTAPPDVYQAHAISDVIMRSGALKVVVINRDDDYGSGLAEAVKDDLASSGIRRTDTKTLKYDVEQKDFRKIAEAVRSFRPDAVLLIGYGESAQVIEAIQRVATIEVMA